MASSSHVSQSHGNESREESISPSGSPAATSSQSPYIDVECFTFGSLNPSVHRVLISAVDKNSSRVLDFASSLDAPSIQKIAKKYLFPNSVLLVIPRLKDRACAPPVGFFTVYEDCLSCGLHLPLPTVYAEFQRKFGIALGKIMPNSFKQLTGLGVVVGRLNFPLTLGMILRFFQFKPSSGWYYLSPRLGFRIKTKTKIVN